MTGPVSVVTLSDVEKQIAEEKAAEEAAKVVKPDTKPLDHKLDGEGVPEELRGKTLAEVIERSKSIEQALRMSEDARLALKRSAEAVAAQPRAEVTPAKEEELTDEQIKTLFEENPAAALRYYESGAMRRVAEHIEARIGPLAGGAISAAMQSAKERNKMDFELFGDQIEAAAASLPDKTALANPQGWDRLIAFVRGQSTNIDRYIEARTKSKLDDARAAEAAKSGFVSTPKAEPHKSAKPEDELDETEREVALKLMPGLEPNEAYKEYAKWKKMA